MRTAWKGNGYGLHIERIRDEDCMERKGILINAGLDSSKGKVAFMARKRKVTKNS